MSQACAASPLLVEFDAKGRLTVQSMAMPLAVFFALQRFFVRGILAGSVKG